MLADIHDQLAKPQMLALTKTCTKTHALLHKTAWPPSAFLARGGKELPWIFIGGLKTGCPLFHRQGFLSVLYSIGTVLWPS